MYGKIEVGCDVVDFVNLAVPAPLYLRLHNEAHLLGYGDVVDFIRGFLYPGAEEREIWTLDEQTQEQLWNSTQAIYKASEEIRTLNIVDNEKEKVLQQLQKALGHHNRISRIQICSNSLL